MAEGAPEPNLRNDGSLAGAADSAAPASPAVETSWNDQDWSQPWGWADWSWRGWQPYRWSWTGRYSYATTRPSGETQSGEQPRQSVGTTDRDAADPDGIPQEPARLDAPSSGPTMTPGTRFSTTSSNSGEASASSAVRPGTTTSSEQSSPKIRGRKRPARTSPLQSPRLLRRLRLPSGHLPVAGHSSGVGLDVTMDTEVTTQTLQPGLGGPTVSSGRQLFAVGIRTQMFQSGSERTRSCALSVGIFRLALST